MSTELDPQTVPLGRPVAIVTRFYPPYPAGAEVNASRLATFLSGQGSCEVVTTRYRRGLPRVQTRAGLRVRRLPTVPGLLARPIEFLGAFAYFLLRGHRFGVVHTMCLSSIALGALLGARVRGVPTVTEACAMGPRGDIQKLIKMPAGRWLWSMFNGAEAFVAPSAIAADHLRSQGVPGAKVEIIPHIAAPGIPARTGVGARADRRRSLGLPAKPIALYVGRLEAAKGVDLLLDAWPEVATVVDAALVLVGDGPLRERAVRESGELPRPHALHVVGPQADPSAYYEAAEVFVFPSRRETFGVALADAMSYGLAVVATPTGLVPTWIRPQRDGVVIPDGDRSAIASALTELLGDEQRRRELGASARRRARAFTPGRVGQMYLALYGRLGSDKASPPRPDSGREAELA